ncbi:MAG: CPBP family glutamic-type intramembrane protease [Cyanobacteria bacterium P01_H01_bin.58]
MIGVVLCAAPIALPLYLYEAAATQGQSIIWAPVCLVIVLVAVLPLWLRQIHRVRHPWRALGCTGGITWLKHWGYAFALGGMSVIGLYVIQLLMGWGQWVGLDADRWLQFLFEGALLGLGVGLAEELLFRGWILFELEQDYPSHVTVGLNACLFAIAHYLRPISSILATWPQFLGLVLLGVTLVWARRIPIKIASQNSSSKHLGFAAGLHGGLVWAYYQFNVGDLVKTTGQVPAWVTGIDNNPLAGLLGIGLLLGLASFTYQLSHRQVDWRI